MPDKYVEIKAKELAKLLEASEYEYWLRERGVWDHFTIDPEEEEDFKWTEEEVLRQYKFAGYGLPNDSGMPI